MREPRTERSRPYRCSDTVGVSPNIARYFTEKRPSFENPNSHLTGVDLREHGPADQRIHQRKNRHNRLKVLFQREHSRTVTAMNPSEESNDVVLGWQVVPVMMSRIGDLVRKSRLTEH